MKWTYIDCCLAAYEEATQLISRFNAFDMGFAQRHPHVKLVADSACLVLGCICLIASIVIATYCFSRPFIQWGNGLAAIFCTLLSILQIWFVQSDKRSVGYAVIMILDKVYKVWLSKLN